MWSAMRRRANMWAMGHAAPKPIVFPEAEGPDLPEGNNTPLHMCGPGEAGGLRRGVRPWLRIPRIPATQSIGRLPLSPRERWLLATLCDAVGIGHHRGH